MNKEEKIMAQYIDKDALVAEIERRIKEHHSGYLVCLKDMLSFINTLEMKEVDSNDAFIEKARKWFEMQNEGIDSDGNYVCDMTDFEYFVKYMKGEKA